MNKQPPIVQASAPVMRRGTVISHHKETNAYTLLPSEGPQVLASAIKAIDMSSQPNTGMGTLVEQQPLCIGTMVWYLDYPFLVWDGVSGKLFARPIIGVDNTLPLPNMSIFPRWVMMPTSKEDVYYFTGANDEVIKAFNGAGGIVNEGDRSFGRPSDACNSDWLAVNAFKGYIRIGADLISMMASPSCGINFSTIEDMCILTAGTTYVRDSASTRETECPDNQGGFIRISSFSFDPAAMMGSFGKLQEAVNGTPLEGVLDIKDEESLPFWGLQEISGNLVSGTLSTLVSKPETSGLNTADTIPVPASVIHRGIDGSMNISAGQGLSLSRGPSIDVLKQLEDATGKPPEDPQEPEEPLADMTDGLSGELLNNADMYAGLMYELMKKRFVERYLKKAKDPNWKAVAAEEICREIFNSEMDKSLSALDADAPCYKLSDSMVEKEDPILEGSKLKMNGRDSFIHFSPTGGIVLSDGHGAEIRLEGGNMTLTCPGDLKLLPGRDMVGLVPRLMSLTSQGRTEITSDKKDVVIRAGQSVSVTATKGTATVESLSTSSSTAKSMKDRDAGKEGGGVIIRSASTTAVVGRNLRLGLQEADDKSEDGRTDPSGTLIIDAGKGSSMFGGGNVYVHGENMVSVVGGESGITAAGSIATLSGSVVGMACTQLLVGGDGAKGLKLTVPVVEPGKGLQDKEVGAEVSTPAQLSIKGNILASDNVVAKTIAANLAAANRMGCLNASGSSGIKMKDAVEPYWTEAKGMTASTSKAATNATKQGVKAMRAVNKDSLFTAAGTKAGGVYYLKPEDYHCAKGHFWTSARWQRLLEGGQTWQFEEIKDALEENDPQYPYPGKKAWKDDNSFVRTLEAKGSDAPSEKNLGSLSKGYKVNATMD